MEEASSPIDLANASEKVRQHVGPSTPAGLKLMAARGMAPMVPRDTLTAQFVLTFDSDPKVAAAADKSLRNLDERLAKAVLQDEEVSPLVLGHLAVVHATNDAYIEPLVLNAKTPTDVFEQVAAVCSEPITELIASNQARVLEAPDIVRGLLQNPNTLKSTWERVIDFLVRSGVILEGVREFEDALLRLGGEDRLAAADTVDIPLELIDERCLSDEQRSEREERTLLDNEEEESSTDPLDNLPLEEKLRRLPLPALVAYATKGNKQVRKTLMRHTNRLVAVAAVTSPMVQEPEIIEAANSKVTHSDVVGHIAKDRKNNWVRIYQVKLGLVKNPKTPPQDAMNLLRLLQPRDIKGLAKDKNVPAAVRNLASSISSRRGR